MSYQKFSNFAVPAIPTTSRRPVPIDQLVKNKWQLPCSSKSSTSNSSSILPSGVVKKVNINGKIVPLKVLSIISPKEAKFPITSPALNARVRPQPTFKSSSKCITFLPSTSTQRQDPRKKSSDSRDENVSSGSEGDENSSDSDDSISFPIRKVDDVYKMEKKMSQGFMKSLCVFLKRQLVGNENIMLQLLQFMYTPECISNFNNTGKKKNRFKSLKINNIFMAILKLKETEYWPKVASALHVMDQRHKREIAKQK